MKPSFFGLSFDDLSETLSEAGLPEEGARLLFNWFYKKKNRAPCTFHNLSSKTQAYLKENLSFDVPNIKKVFESPDKTVKFVFDLHDHKNVDCVLIPFQGKYTVCLSSQVGCQMKCAFCFTGEQGLTRHLRTDEIVGMFLQIHRWLRQARPEDCRILNVVFMGQGEPLHNFEVVKKTCEIFLSQFGLSLAAHKITVSTAGYLPGLERWKQEMPDVNVALSLHSVRDEKRSQLIPLNRAYPLEKIISKLEDIPTGKKRFVTYEYLVLEGFNDTDEEIHEVGQKLQGTKAFINLIPFNPYPGAKFKRPGDEKLMRFKSILESYRIPTTVRTSKGQPILAACGQLNSFCNESILA